MQEDEEQCEFGYWWCDDQGNDCGCSCCCLCVCVVMLGDIDVDGGDEQCDWGNCDYCVCDGFVIWFVGYCYEQLCDFGGMVDCGCGDDCGVGCDFQQGFVDYCLVFVEMD